MKQLGMRYQYSYEELWQPKNIPVTFRLYQLNLDGQEDRVYPVSYTHLDVYKRQRVRGLKRLWLAGRGRQDWSHSHECVD